MDPNNTTEQFSNEELIFFLSSYMYYFAAKKGMDALYALNTKLIVNDMISSIQTASMLKSGEEEMVNAEELETKMITDLGFDGKVTSLDDLTAIQDADSDDTTKVGSSDGTAA